MTELNRSHFSLARCLGTLTIVRRSQLASQTHQMPCNSLHSFLISGQTFLNSGGVQLRICRCLGTEPQLSVFHSLRLHTFPDTSLTPTVSGSDPLRIRKILLLSLCLKSKTVRSFTFSAYTAVHVSTPNRVYI